METKNIIKLCVIVALVSLLIGVGIGIDYAGKQGQKQTEKINVLYGMTYLADKSTNTVALNIIVNDKPEIPLLKNHVVLNKYDILDFSDKNPENHIVIAFEGFSDFGSPVFRFLLSSQEENGYISWVKMMTREVYTPNIIFRQKS